MSDNFCGYCDAFSASLPENRISMKKIIFTFALAMPFMLHARHEENTDSISNTLGEVVITADAQIETAKKVIIRPTRLEKKHSTNCYTLLENMNLPYFNVDASAQTLSTITGRDVIVLVNGVETQSAELATLPAAEIVQIDCQRNPGGKYAGCGAVMNFITARYDFGGNIYLSTDEGLARQYGNYVGMVSYRKKAITLTLTANGKWDHISQSGCAENTFLLNDGLLNQSVDQLENRSRTNSQYLNLKFAHAAGNHAFDIALALTRSASPGNFRMDDVAYTGLYDFKSTATRRSSEVGLSPVMKLHYNLYLPGGHTFMAFANIRHGHTRFKSSYLETDVDEITNNILENNIIAGATLGYFKSFANGLNIGVTVDEYYNRYYDSYSGSFNSKQILTNNHAMTMFHIDCNLPAGLSCYASAGITGLYSAIGDHRDNQFSPKAFYGLTYAVNQKHTVSITGHYAHSIYNPSYKNDACIPTSFFEVALGNPDLGQLKAFQNFVSYNGRISHFGISFTYDFLKYFGNTSTRYFAEDNIMFHQLVNDGSFHYHKLIFGASANLVDNRLRLKANATYGINRFDSVYRPAASNGWRADFSASYMFGDWLATAKYALPYNVLGIEGVMSHHPAQYGVSVCWRKGNWAAECSVENFLDRRMSARTVADYGVYRSLSRDFSDLSGRNISLSVTYMLPYGKKTENERVETESVINSAILRPF